MGFYRCPRLKRDAALAFLIRDGAPVSAEPKNRFGAKALIGTGDPTFCGAFSYAF
jgi:hypothetical protein